MQARMYFKQIERATMLPVPPLVWRTLSPYTELRLLPTSGCQKWFQVSGFKAFHHFDAYRLCAGGEERKKKKENVLVFQGEIKMKELVNVQDKNRAILVGRTVLDGGDIRLKYIDF